MAFLAVPYFYPIIVNDMKRKDTKRYDTLVKSYVDARRFCERRQKEIDDYKRKLDEDEHNMNITIAVLRGCDFLIEWIKGLVEGKVAMMKTLIGLMESNLCSDREEMEKCASILVSEYEENLDVVYTINK